MAKKKIVLVLAHIENYKWIETEMRVKSVEKGIEFGKRKLCDNNNSYSSFFIMENGVLASKKYMRATLQNLVDIINNSRVAIVNHDIYNHPKLALVKGGYVVLPGKGTEILLG